MMSGFIHTFKSNLQENRGSTIIFIALHALVAFVGGAILDDFMGMGFIGFVLVAAGVVFASTKVSKFGWFWEAKPSVSDGPAYESQANNVSGEITAGTTEPEPETMAAHQPKKQQRSHNRYEKIRETPVGTRVIKISHDEAILEVKSAIQFWCWFAPSGLTTLALCFIPVGAWLGLSFYENSVETWQFNAREAASAAANGAIILPVLGFTVAIWSYFSNRPWVRITVTPDIIQYGDRRFDRSQARGMRVGYSSQEADLAASITKKGFGVTQMRLGYGRWGEDLKYMVNSYHASEIVVWMNEIIDSVGEQIAPRHDPYAGKKIELL